MKKFFVLAAACCAMALNATTYTCHLKVDINGTATEQDEVTVDINENNGTYDLNLKNFVLSLNPEYQIAVGNIAVSGVQGVDEHGYTTIKFNDIILITEGDDPSVDFWAGPLLGEVPIDMTARFTPTAASANIDIDMQTMLGQIIKVSIFGVAPADAGIEGDVNKDGEVSIGDINKVIDIILSE